MGNAMKRYLAIFLGIFIFSQTCYVASAEEALELSAKTAILMEAETGKVLYEKEADQALYYIKRSTKNDYRFAD